MRSDDNRLLSAVRLVVPDFVRKRFTLKFALILAVMGIAIGFIGATATGMVSAQVEDNAEQEYQDLATQQANVVEKWVQRNSISVKLASKNDALSQQSNGSEYVIRNELSTTAGNLYGVQSIYVANHTQSGASVVASPQLGFGTDLGDVSRGWIADVPVDQLGVAEVHITDVHSVDGTPVIAFVSPVQGAPNRSLVIEYDLRQLASSLDQGSRASRFTQVVDGNGEVAVATSTSEILQPYGSEQAMEPVRRAQALSNASAGVIARAGPNPSVLDAEYTVGYAPVEVTNSELEWTVLVHEPTSNVFGFVQTISTWGTAATLGAMVLIGLLGAAIGFSTTRDINRLRERAEQMREGDLDTTVESGRIDSIGQLYAGFDDMRQSLKAQIREAEQARKEAEVARAETEETNNYLQERAEEYSEIMRAGARGDLTRRMEPEGENEAMDRIAEEFNGMIEELEMTTGQLKTFAEEVEEGGQSLQQSAETVREASEQVADSVQKISDDAYDQKERLRDISEEMDAIADRLEDADSDAGSAVGDALERVTEVARTVEEAAQLGEETMAESENVAGAAEEQAAELNEVSARAEELTRYAQYLGDGLNNFETEEEHEFVFQTGASGPGASEGSDSES